VADRNEQLVDESVQRDKQIQERAAAIIAAAIALLDSSEPELRVLLERYLAVLTQPGVDLSAPIIQARLATMKQEIADLRGRYLTFVTNSVRTQNEELVRDEWAFLLATYASTAGLALTLPGGESIPEILATPFLGRDYDTWLNDLAVADANRINDAVVTGLIQRRPRQDILEAVLGDADLDGGNGATQITRNHLTSIIDSGSIAVAAQARDDLVQENDTDLPREVYVAVLDNRTTRICRGLHARVFPTGQGPIPPLHWNCRSTRVPLPPDGDVPKVP
jgi:SPP1 gp7 family putative phage head morphogenesis protein